MAKSEEVQDVIIGPVPKLNEDGSYDEYDLKRIALQQEIASKEAQYNVKVIHRRAGKTVGEIKKAIVKNFECKHKNPRYGYVAPTYKQAKGVAWDYLKDFSRTVPGVTFNESELRADYPGGGRITLYGAENPHALRGLYFDGVILDEVAQMPSIMWDEIISPALTDRNGWCDFIGTPRGHNFFHDLYQSAQHLDNWQSFYYPASETGIIPDWKYKELFAQAEQRGREEEFYQEYECSWTAAIKGAYYAKIIAQLEKDKKIGSCPYDPALLVETWWDIGIADQTSIWFVQRHRNEIRVIDFYENFGEGLAHYIRIINEKPYTYGDHIGPHDLKVREFGTGATRIEQARKLGLRFKIAPKISVQDGIDIVRATLPTCVFDEEKTRKGRECLIQYQKNYDPKRNIFSSKPLHDWSSHAADAFRYGCVYKTTKGPSKWGGRKGLKINTKWIT